MVVWDLVVGLSAVDVQAAEIRSDERLLMEFEETFGETKGALENEVDVEIEIMMNSFFFLFCKL